MVFSELYSGLDTTSIGAMHCMGVEASYYNVQYISSKEKGFSETFFRTKISQYTVYYILLYPSWIDKFIATKKGRIKPTFSLFLRCLLIKLQVRNIHRRRHEKFSYTASMFVVLSPRYYDYFRSFCILLPHPLTVCNAFFHLY